MAQRSRKRGRRSKAEASEHQEGAVAVRPVPDQIRTVELERTRPGSVRSDKGVTGALSRSEQKNAAVRATLEPYPSGERPRAIWVAVVVAILIGAGDLVDVLVGGNLGFGGSHPANGGVIVFAVLMLICATGMWRMKYWAVLGFQAILAFVVLFFSLALIRASNVAGAVIGVVVICGGGFLFYKLVRVLSRIQMPRRARP